MRGTRPPSDSSHEVEVGKLLLSFDDSLLVLDSGVVDLASFVELIFIYLVIEPVVLALLLALQQPVLDHSLDHVVRASLRHLRRTTEHIRLEAVTEDLSVVNSFIDNVLRNVRGGLFEPLFKILFATVE